MTLYDVAGLNQQVELPVPLYVRLVPLGQTRQRPGIRRQTPGAWVQHETANYNVGANAEMHCRYLLQGAGGQTLSYHFTVDDKAIYQMIPVDEVTWQAADGGGPGNMAGVSCELCVNRDADWAKARHNAEALAGAVSKALGITAITRHYDYNQSDPDRHFCPKEMMTEGYWPTFVRNVQAIIGGTADVPTDPTAYPVGMDEGVAKMLFGKVKGDDGKSYGFDPKGPISQQWLEHGKTTGEWPELSQVKHFDDRTYFVFSSGWTLWRAGGGAFGQL